MPSRFTTVTGFPAPGWRCHCVAADFVVRVDRAIPQLPIIVDAEVEQIWTRARTRSGGALFNGRVFSTDEIGPDLLSGHWTEYRRVVAQMERPDLFETLGLRPTAAGGLLLCADGVVFGRRPRDAVYQAGLWQLPPAGSLDPSAARTDGTVDVLATLFTELREEMGLDRSDIERTRLLCLAEHPGSHVLDLGIELVTKLDEPALRAAHGARGNGEYSELAVAPLTGLAAAIDDFTGAVTPQTLAFLAAAGHLVDLNGPGNSIKAATLARRL